MKSIYVLFHTLMCIIGCVILIILSFVNNVNIEQAALDKSDYIISRICIDFCFIILFLLVTYIVSYVIWRNRITLKYQLYTIIVELIAYSMVILFASYKWSVLLQNVKY